MSIKECLFAIRVTVRMWFYHLQYAFLRKERNSIQIVGPTETIDYILNKRCSVARLGDGEIEMITCLLEGYDDSRKSAFQNFDKKLANRLIEIVGKRGDEKSNIIVCLPAILTHPVGVKRKTRKFVERCFVNNYRTLAATLDLSTIYYDTNFTRFYIDYIDKDKADYVTHLRKIWNDRELCIIEGEQSRLGVGNDLFDNARNIERILCPAVNAFGSYDRILERALKVDKQKLVLIALGQTATVLAYDMAQEGYQAIDIGHVDVEYEWFLMQTDEKIPLKNKYVNEVESGRIYTEESDSNYLKQIVDKIS